MTDQPALWLAPWIATTVGPITFTPPAARSETAHPAKYKMTFLTTVGLYPLIVVIGAFVAAVNGLPVALGTLVTVTIVAAVATYWVMPWVTRVFRRWLFPES